MGPVVSAEQLERIQRYVRIGQDEGAELALGGSRHGDRGYFHQPTVFTGVRNDMTIAQEEIFGPVMSVLKFSSEEEAYRIANDVEYGLAAGVWTATSRAHRASRSLRVGTVWVNTYQMVYPVLRRRQAVRPRPQPRRGLAGRVHADQERLDEGRLTWRPRPSARIRDPRAAGPHGHHRRALSLRVDDRPLRPRRPARARGRSVGAVRERRAGRRRRGRGLDRRGDRERRLAAPPAQRLPRGSTATAPARSCTTRRTRCSRTIRTRRSCSWAGTTASSGASATADQQARARDPVGRGEADAAGYLALIGGRGPQA